MKNLLAFRKIGLWLIGLVLVVALAATAGTIIPRPLWKEEQVAPTAQSPQRILLLSNAIHTDIAIPLTPDTRSRFAFLEVSGMPLWHPDARWLIFGWGGRAFYTQTPTWADLKPLPLLKGLTLDSAVMHVDIAGDIPEGSAGVAGYAIGTEGYERLLSYISDSFVSEAGAIAAIPDTGYGANDRFFEGTGWFNALAGCNTWTAGALRQAGLRTGWWNPLPVSLRFSMALHNGR